MSFDRGLEPGESIEDEFDSGTVLLLDPKRRVREMNETNNRLRVPAATKLICVNPNAPPELPETEPSGVSELPQLP
jgi:hypothetical protein